MVYREIKSVHESQKAKKSSKKKTKKSNIDLTTNFTRIQLENSLKNLINSDNLKLIINVEKNGSKLKAISLEGVDLTPLFTKNQLEQLFTNDKSCKVHQDFFNPEFPKSFDKGVIDKYTLENLFNDTPWHKDKLYCNTMYDWVDNITQRHCKDELTLGEFFGLDPEYDYEKFDMYWETVEEHHIDNFDTLREEVIMPLTDWATGSKKPEFYRKKGIDLQKKFIIFCINKGYVIKDSEILMQFVFNSHKSNKSNGEDLDWRWLIFIILSFLYLLSFYI